jgi:hypothetical protein
MKTLKSNLVPIIVVSIVAAFILLFAILIYHQNYVCIGRLAQGIPLACIIVVFIKNWKFIREEI